MNKNDKNIVLLTEYQYFGCIDWFKKLSKYSNIAFELYDWHPKLSFRNRTVIAGANGPIVLSVPLVGGREQKTLSGEVNINYSERWQQQHWRAIESSYRKAPFFEFYADSVQQLLFTQHEFLWQLDAATCTWLMKVLKLKLTVSHTDAFLKTLPENWEDGRYYTKPGTLQNDADSWQPVYPQVFEDRLGFLPNLSVLDLLFCTGPKAQTLVLE
jgi:hypothetical protein